MGWFRMPDGSLLNLDRLGLVWAEDGKVYGSTSPTQRLASVVLFESAAAAEPEAAGEAAAVFAALERAGTPRGPCAPSAADFRDVTEGLRQEEAFLKRAIASLGFPDPGTGKGDATSMGPSPATSP